MLSDVARLPSALFGPELVRDADQGATHEDREGCSRPQIGAGGGGEKSLVEKPLG